MIIKRVGINVNETKKVAGKPGLKFCLVQILVVVQLFMLENLKVDEEKGFKRTLLELE